MPKVDVARQLNYKKVAGTFAAKVPSHLSRYLAEV